MGKLNRRKITPPEPAVEAPAVEPAPEVQFVEPSPVPITFQISEVVNDETDQAYIVLTVFSATGQSTYFLEPGLALALGEILTKKAAEYTETSPDVQ